MSKDPPITWRIFLLSTTQEYKGLGWQKEDPYQFTQQNKLLTYSDQLHHHWFDLLWDIVTTNPSKPQELIFAKGFLESFKLPALKGKWQIRYWKNLTRWRKKSDPGRAGVELIVPTDWSPRTWRTWAREQTDILTYLKNP